MKLPLILGLSLLLGASPVAAQNYPSGPINIVVPSVAGGASDIVARLFQQAVGDKMGEPFVILNMPGGGTALGAREVATSPADGQTVLMMHEAMITASALGVFDLGYSSLVPVAQTGRDVYTITVRADSGIETLEELYQEAAERELVTAVNIGGLGHLTSLIAAEAGGVEFAPVHYPGGIEWVTALLGGHVDVIFSVPSDVVGYIESGDFRTLAVMSDERVAALPDVPTTVELGYDAKSELNHMWWMPAGTPEDVIDTFADTLEAAMEDEMILQQFKNRFIEPVFSRGEELQAYVSEVAGRIEKLVADYDLQPN